MEYRASFCFLLCLSWELQVSPKAPTFISLFKLAGISVTVAMILLLFSSSFLIQPTHACISLKVNINNRDQRYSGESTWLIQSQQVSVLVAFHIPHRTGLLRCSTEIPWESSHARKPALAAPLGLVQLRRGRQRCKEPEDRMGGAGGVSTRCCGANPVTCSMDHGMMGTAPTAAALTSRGFEPQQVTAITCKAAQCRCGWMRQLASLQHVCDGQHKEKTSSLFYYQTQQHKHFSCSYWSTQFPKVFDLGGSKTWPTDSKPSITFMREMATHEQETSLIINI